MGFGPFYKWRADEMDNAKRKTLSTGKIAFC